MKPIPVERSFASVLRHYRVIAGLSQEALAERAGISVRGVSDLERGRSRAPRLDTLRRLSDAMELGTADREILRRASSASSEPPQIWPGVQNAPAPIHSPPGLPGYLTPLLGRAWEAAQLTQLLREDRVRLLTLLGPGGVGKTRLAVHVAADLGDTYPDGVVLVPLAPLRDPGLVLVTIAQSLGVAESTERPPLEVLSAAMAGRRVLLVLDNCEHLLEAAPVLAELLGRCPSLRILATSRALLRVSGEETFVVGSLATPEHVAEPDAALAYSAIALFVERAQSVQQSFALTSENLEAVISICRRLDGLPLALELAAARTLVLPPAALLARMEQRLTVLTSGARDAPLRHQTLQNTIAWSYDLLTEDEQKLFRQLGVFASGWSLVTAEAVCAEPGAEPSVLDHLATLVDHSLVQPMAEAGGQARFGMAETVREYALERLAYAGEAQAVRRRHAVESLRLAEEAEPHLIQGDPTVWLRRLDLEVDNLRLALAWSIGTQGDLELGGRLAGSLALFWYLRGYVQEGRMWLERLVAAEVPGTATLDHARALLSAGTLALLQADSTARLAYQERSASLYRALDGANEVVQQLHANTDAVSLLAESLDLLRARPDHLEQGQRELAILTALPSPLLATEGFASSRLIDVQLRALELADALGIEPAAPLLRSLATACLANGDLIAARQFAHQLQSRGERDGDDVLVVESQYVLGIAAFWQGEFASARRSFETALDRYQPEHGATHLLWYGLDPKVICLGRLGITFWFLGQAESAMRAREASLRLAEEIGHPLSRGSALVFAAMLAIELRDWEGVRAYTASLAAGRADDEARFIQLSADTLSSYVEVLDRRQPTAIARIEQALEEAGEAEPAPGLYALIMRILLEAYAVVGDARAGLANAERMLLRAGTSQLWRSETHRMRAEFRRALGAEASEIEADLERALEVAREQGALALEVRAAISLVRHREQGRSGNRSEARARLAALIDALPEGRATADVREAISLLRQA